MIYVILFHRLQKIKGDFMSHFKRISFFSVCIIVCLAIGCMPNKSQSYGTVIILNGPSAVGKSSIVKAFQEKQTTPWLGMGIDTLFVAVVPMKCLLDPSYNVMQGFATEDEQGKLFTVHFKSEGQKIIKGMHRAIAAYAHMGNNIIVDYIT
jgi:chloramphenicol 3-O-phosphotransferase